MPHVLARRDVACHPLGLSLRHRHEPRVHVWHLASESGERPQLGARRWAGSVCPEAPGTSAKCLERLLDHAQVDARMPASPLGG